jgi:hypothetical protein
MNPGRVCTSLFTKHNRGHMRRISRVLFVAVMAMSTAAIAGGAAAPAAKKGAPAAPTAKKTPPPPPKKAAPPVSAEHKKTLAALYGGFKFGMSKDEVLGVLSKQLDDRYADKLKATTDMAVQDNLRREKKDELARVKASSTDFNGKRTGWDVSIIEDEFAHGTGESMIERWENSDGKNQRRFFFFKDGKLWKMFISLDVSILPADKKTFPEFQGRMEKLYGPGDVNEQTITWRTDEFEVRATDKLKTYDALGLSIAEPRVQKELLAEREAKAPKKAETNAVIKAVVDADHSDHPDVKNSGTSAIDAVIQANPGGGTTPPTKTPKK